MLETNERITVLIVTSVIDVRSLFVLFSLRKLLNNGQSNIEGFAVFCFPLFNI